MPQDNYNFAEPPELSGLYASTEQTEFLSHEIAAYLHARYGDGAVIGYETAEEQTQLADDIADFLDDFDTWLEAADSAIAANESLPEGEQLPVPAPPTLPDRPGESWQSRLIRLVLKIAIELLIRWLRNRKKHDKNKGPDEIAAYIKAAFCREKIVGEETVLTSVLERVAEQRDVKVSFLDGKLAFFPGTLMWDVDELEE
jgi:hypothetical protein